MASMSGLANGFFNTIEVQPSFKWWLSRSAQTAALGRPLPDASPHKPTNRAIKKGAARLHEILPTLRNEGASIVNGSQPARAKFADNLG